MPIAPSGSASSDYFEPEDPDFLRALEGTVLPGDVPILSERVEVPRATLKRKHSEPLSEESSNLPIAPEFQGPRSNKVGDEDEDTYGASRFGGLGDYMRRKRAKLQIQNQQIPDSFDGDISMGSAEEGGRGIFQGIAIYVRLSRLWGHLDTHAHGSR